MTGRPYSLPEFSSFTVIAVITFISKIYPKSSEDRTDLCLRQATSF